MFKHLLRYLIILILLGGSAAGIWYSSRPQPVEVNVYVVEQGVVEAKVTNTRAGTVKACHRAALTPSGGGQVARLLVREGESVAAGALLLELWNDDLKALLKLAQSERDAARARADEACLKADVAKRESRRLVKLYQEKAVSEEQIDRVRTEAHVAKAGCRAAQAAIQVAAEKIAQAQANLERTRLTAPFAGIIAEINGEAGEFVTPSPPGIPMPPAIDLVDSSCLYVSAPIDEVDAPAIKLDMPVRISLDAFDKQTFQGTVRRIAPYALDIEKQARTVEVEVAFIAAQDLSALLPGYSADVEIITARHADALHIPTQALQEGKRVLVFGTDGLLTEQPVTTGLSNWQSTEILDGLQAGTAIVTSLGDEGVRAGVYAIGIADEKAP